MYIHVHVLKYSLTVIFTAYFGSLLTSDETLVVRILDHTSHFVYHVSLGMVQILQCSLLLLLFSRIILSPIFFQFKSHINILTIKSMIHLQILSKPMILSHYQSEWIYWLIYHHTIVFKIHKAHTRPFPGKQINIRSYQWCNR